LPPHVLESAGAGRDSGLERELDFRGLVLPAVVGLGDLDRLHDVALGQGLGNHEAREADALGQVLRLDLDAHRCAARAGTVVGVIDGGNRRRLREIERFHFLEANDMLVDRLQFVLERVVLGLLGSGESLAGFVGSFHDLVHARGFRLAGREERRDGLSNRLLHRVGLLGLDNDFGFAPRRREWCVVVQLLAARRGPQWSVD
jgi:hypothetical protein